MELRLHRDTCAPGFTLGKLYVDDDFLGYTCEDEDRQLESGGEKVYGKTAIPRGRYRVSRAYWSKFKVTVPHILDVPGFTGIYIHGGNNADDSFGCPLLGAVRTPDGVKDAKGVNQHLRDMIEMAEIAKEEVWITID